jgi:thiamine-monophosphate kinase
MAMVNKERHFPSNEFELLSGLKELVNGLPLNNFEVGIGDDAAVRRCLFSEKLIFTTDISVENVHFKIEYMSLREIGYRAMVSNLSDCAAMGACPDSALIQLTFPENCQNLKEKVMELYLGFTDACRKWNFPIVGGDLSSGPVWVIGITLMGTIPATRNALLRTGVKHGDSLWVSGTPGRSASGLAALSTWKRENIPSRYTGLVQAHISPVPRVELGCALLNNGNVHAMMDLSDGLSKDCRTLAYENDCGCILFSGASHIPGEMIQLSSELGIPWENWYFHGGEEYELLFATSGAFHPAQVHTHESMICIGTFSEEITDVVVEYDGKRSPLGRGSYDHIRW